MFQRLSDNTRGAALMIASMAAFTFNDVFIKLAAENVAFFQLVFLRGVLASALLLALGLWLGSLRLRLPARDWGLIAIRSLCETLAAFFFLTALFNMPIANATAILQVTPLAVTLASMVILREHVGWRRMTAILAGFAGMLLIVRPGPEGFNVFAGWALAAVLMITFRDLAARQLGRDVPSMTVALVGALVIMVAAGVMSITETWQPVSSGDALLIATAAVFILGGYLFSVMVMRVGDVGAIAPFRYSGLVWALFLGFVVFGEWPDILTLAGAAIVVATGVFTLYREARLARRQARVSR